MARLPDLSRSAAQHGLRMFTVADLIEYRRRTEKLVERDRRARAARPSYGDVPRCRLPRVDRPAAARRARQGRRRRGRGRPGARPLRVPDRRRLPLAPLRLRRAARTTRCAQIERGGPRRRSLYIARRAAASAWSTSSRHTSCRTRGWTRSRPTSRSASRPTCGTTASAARSSPTSGCEDPPADEQPEEDRRHRGLRPEGRRAGADRGDRRRRERRYLQTKRESSATPLRAASTTRACASSRPPSRSGSVGAGPVRPSRGSRCAAAMSRGRSRRERVAVDLALEDLPGRPLGSCVDEQRCGAGTCTRRPARGIQSLHVSPSSSRPAAADDERDDLLAEPSSGTPITAASSTSGCAYSASSTSRG